MLFRPKGKRAKWMLAITLALLVFGLWMVYRDYRNEEIFRRFQEGGEKALTPMEFQKLAEILPEKYKADTYGADTPEGTLALFITALKNGDADLASKYFIPEKQVEYKKAVENWTRLGKNGEISSTLSQATNQRINNDGTGTMGVFQGERSFMTIFFLKNNYSGKWLIQSL